MGSRADLRTAAHRPQHLPIAPSTYYAASKRPPSARALRDEELKLEIL